MQPPGKRYLKLAAFSIIHLGTPTADFALHNMFPRC